MIVVDVETTGLSPEKNSIVSIGAVDFANPENQFYGECQVWDGAEIDDFALKVNGFTEEQVKDLSKKSLNDLVSEFLIWTEKFADKTIAGENPSFDTGFLEDSAKRYDLNWPFGYRIVDLHTLSYSNYLSRELQPQIKKNKSDLSLNKTLVYVGLPEEPNPHNALIGAKMEAEAFSRIICGTNLLKEFEQYKIPVYLKK
ncbi:3'-5' exonuclease [Candidatus Woesearchaeota archaeon]|nr:3'-5' exonuclease [Candidatus Woesearchaeota archaeon]